MKVRKGDFFKYEASQYQKDIFNFVRHGHGNAVIQAFAGSAKTSTAIGALGQTDADDKCLFVAFNNSITEELKEKMKDCDTTNVDVMTIHSLGYLIVRANLGNDVKLDQYKYSRFVKNNICSLSTICDEFMSEKTVERYVDNIIKLVDYSRFYLCQCEREIKMVADKYDIPVTRDECSVVRKCLDWGKQNVESIDYTDMVWLPYELSLHPKGNTYNWIFFDEAQDASLMAIELLKRCFRRGTRMISFGDENQAIYAFAGSMKDAFTKLKELPHTTTFSLPISYRCPREVVKLANKFVPEMTAMDDAIDGEIIAHMFTKDLGGNDMVLCRTTAPLLKIYNKLLRMDVKCHMKGGDFGDKLIELLNSIDCDELNASLLSDGVFVRLYDKLFNVRNDLIVGSRLDIHDATLSQPVMYLYDVIKSLLVLGEKCNKKSTLIERIKKVFADDNDNNGVCLSTIHKAKGLEADNVYIACSSKLPSQSSKKDWEREQEKNLAYVAYTRAKKKLGFLDENEIRPNGSMLDYNQIISDLNYIENKVCEITGVKAIKHSENSEMSRFRLRNTPNADMHSKDNKAVIEKNEDSELSSSDDLLAELLSL